jgi:hypothetical protein
MTSNVLYYIEVENQCTVIRSQERSKDTEVTNAVIDMARSGRTFRLKYLKNEFICPKFANYASAKGLK